MESIGLVVAVITMVAAILTLFGVRLRRRKLWLSARVESLVEFPEGWRREEVVIELITGPEPVLLEVVSLSPTGKPDAGWTLSMTPGPQVDGWPKPLPTGRLVRLDARSATTYRLGWLSAPARFIDRNGEVTVRPYVLLARPSLSRGWPHRLGTPFLKLVKRTAGRHGTPISVHAWPSEDPATQGQEQPRWRTS